MGVQQATLATFGDGSGGGPPPGPDIAFLASVSAGGTGANSDPTTGPIDTTGASAIYVGTAQFFSGGIVVPTISDSEGNTYTLEESHAANSQQVAIYKADAPIATDPAHTFTATQEGGYPSIAVLVVENAEEGGASDVSAHDTVAGSATLAVGPVTPTTPNQIVVTVMSGGIAATPTIDDGFTVAESEQNVGGQHVQIGMAYKIQSSATVEEPTWNAGGSGNITAAIASFKKA